MKKNAKAKPLTSSKTFWFNVFMGGIEALHAGIQILSPVLPPEKFAVVTLVVGVIHGAGGIYLRKITTSPVA